LKISGDKEAVTAVALYFELSAANITEVAPPNLPFVALHILNNPYWGCPGLAKVK
jgi:hypothetical protein